MTESARPGWLASREQRILQATCSWERQPLIRTPMLIATRIADGWGLFVLIPAVLIFGKERGLPAVGCGTISAVTIGIVVQSIKALVRRSRPSGIVMGRPITAPDRHAFPSGHTAHSFGMVVISGWVSPWMLLISLPMALAVGLSRLVFGLHYPTDVGVGAVLGMLIAWLSIRGAETFGLVQWLAGISPFT